MEPTLFGIITWVAGLLVTTGLTWTHSRLAKSEGARVDLERDFRGHLAALPTQYVLKGDYKADVEEIKLALRDMRQELREALNGHA